MTSVHQALVVSVHIVGVLLTAPVAHAADNSPAYVELMHGRVDSASKLLLAQLQANPSDAHAHLLLCRVNYAQDLSDQAIDHCEKATQLTPNDANTHLWLARAYGQKAGHTNPVAAYKLAGRVRTSFERAAQLDPRNIEALSDLAEYYIDAPSFLGGDETKAHSLASSLLPLSPVRSHRINALLAEKDGDKVKAEAEYKAAIAVNNSPEAWSDLAIFYEREKRKDDAVIALQRALDADRTHGPVEVDVASVLTSLKRNPELAEKALRNYIASANQDDGAPVFKAHLHLGRLLDKRGDHTGAKAEYNAAIALAPNYEPARKALED